MLLEHPGIDLRVEIAACLADIAAEAPDDVAPSAATLAAVAVDRSDQPVAGELIRCFAILAADRPAVVGDQTTAITAVLEHRQGYDRHGLRALARISTRRPEEVVQAVPVLAEALAANPTEHGRTVLRTFGRLARSDVAVPTLEFVERAVELVDHDEAALRRDAISCLGDVARDDPGAVEPVCTELEGALSDDDADTRAVAALAFARVASENPAVVDPVRTKLLDLLDDDHAHVRANACAALGYGDVDAAAARLTDLTNRDPSPIVRDRADWALEQRS
ncbi:HEAT repeat domain-containing protein [Natrinema caseinilyticum]|uniref:HEAT repeat domain-containing protein n=1 Tax=Natrinema caseinilyticum TaxID=2961570 RepID=UPI0030F453DA